MSEITYKPTFESLPTLNPVKVERMEIKPQHIFSKDEPDQEYENFFNPYICSMAKQIKQQRKWLDMAHCYSEMIENENKAKNSK